MIKKAAFGPFFYGRMVSVTARSGHRSVVISTNGRDDIQLSGKITLTLLIYVSFNFFSAMTDLPV